MLTLVLLCQKIYPIQLQLLKYMIKVAYNLLFFSSYINDIKTSSASGPDEIPPKFVKIANIIMTPNFTKLYNKCIQQEIVTDAFKIAHVIPIPKVSHPRSLIELKPISLSVFSKLFEKILEAKMIKFRNKNSIIIPFQYGSKTYSSTDLAITMLYENFLSNLLQSYLSNCLVCPKMNGNLSKGFYVGYGIPQGSVVESLFYLFVNDLSKGSIQNHFLCG